MSEPSSENPLAEFGTPKPSAVEYLQSRREQDRKDRRAYWLHLAVLAGTSAVVAAGGACVAGGWPVLPASLGLAFAGTILGVLVGWLVGATSWAGLTFRSQAPAPFKPIGSDMVQGNSWDKLTVWLSVWAGIGIAAGGGVGAAKGAALAGQAVPNAVMPWSFGGAAIGTLIGLVGWLVVRHWLRAEPATTADRPRD
jgi:hypothetical protein